MHMPCASPQATSQVSKAGADLGPRFRIKTARFHRGSYGYSAIWRHSHVVLGGGIATMQEMCSHLGFEQNCSPSVLNQPPSALKVARRMWLVAQGTH